MTEDEKKLIQETREEFRADGLDVQTDDESIYAKIKQLERNMSDFINSTMGKDTRDFADNFQFIDNALAHVINNQLPTHETADFMRKQLSDVAGNVTYVIAVTAGKDKEAQDMISNIYEDFVSLRGVIEWYAGRVSEMADLWPELSAELKHPEYEGHDVNDLIKDNMARRREKDYSETDNPALLDIAIAAARKARRERAAAARLQTLYSPGSPNNYIATNTALESAMLAIDGKAELIGNGWAKIQTARKKKNRPETNITAVASLENMDGIEFKGKPWGLYDQAVHWAVCSIVADRQEKNLPPVATPDMIYRVMAGLTNQEAVGEEAEKEVRDSIEKQRNHIKVYADITDDVRNYHPELVEDGKRFILDDYVLASRRLTVTSGNKKVQAYHFATTPLLLDYGRITNKLIREPLSIMKIRDIDSKGNILPESVVSNSPARIMIRDFLLRRLIQYRGDLKAYKNALAAEKKRKQRATKKGETYIPEPVKKPHSNKILFDTLYAAVESSAGLTEETIQKGIKTRRKRYRDYVQQVLDYWKAAGHIADYKIERKGNTINAVILDVGTQI